MLTPKQLADVCLLYSGNAKQCRYLEEDPSSWNFFCIKLSPNSKKKKDGTIANFLQECKQKGVDPTQQGIALGDNCSGYPIMKNSQQGYDVD